MTKKFVTLTASDQGDKANEVISLQKKKIALLRKKGHSCYEYEYATNDHTIILTAKDHCENETQIAGRIIELNAEQASGTIIDSGRRINFRCCDGFVQKDIIELLDLGDIIGLSGHIGENSIFICNKIVILTKTLLPIDILRGEKYCPYKFKHLSLILDPDTRKSILLRNKVISSIRSFLTSKEFLEVDTPVLQPFQGDSTALPLFTDTTVHDIRFALASSPELYLKKLLVGGFNKVFAIGKAFRDEEVNSTHLMEFLSVEYYMAYVDYNYMMNFTEKLFRYILKKTVGSCQIHYKGHDLDFSGKWERVSIHKSLKDMFHKDLYSLNKDELIKIAAERGILYERPVSEGNIIIDLFDKFIGSKLVQPTFVIDYPLDATVMCYDITMAKVKRGTKNILERFELYIGGLEIANCYSELNNPEEQYSAFEKFLKNRNRQVKIDPNFYHALCVGLPPSSGVGFGIDRLVMILANKPNVYDVTTFSTFHESR